MRVEGVLLGASQVDQTVLTVQQCQRRALVLLPKGLNYLPELQIGR